MQRHALRYHWIVLLFCLLDLLDLLAFSRLVPYDIVGPQLLENPDFSQGLRGWMLGGEERAVQIEGGVLRIDHPSVSDKTTLSQCYPAQEMPNDLFLSAQAMSRGVLRGEKPWHKAKIDLVGYDAQNAADYFVKTRLIGMEGDQAWVENTQVYQNKSSYRQICVKVSLHQASGLFQIKGLALHQAKPNPNYRAANLLMSVGWVVLGLWLAKVLFEYYRERPQGRYLLVVLGMLLIGILMPQAMRAILEAHILSFLSYLDIVVAPAETLQRNGFFDLWPKQWDLSKISHLLGFTLLSSILFTERRVSPVGPLFGLLLLAVATELLQFYVPDRMPRLSDVMVDCLGILIGWGLGSLFRLFIGRSPGMPPICST